MEKKASFINFKDALLEVRHKVQETLYIFYLIEQILGFKKRF
jgi:hypothetical protein